MPAATAATQAAATAGQPTVVLWFFVRLLEFWEPGLVRTVKAILKAQTSTFTHLQDDGKNLAVTSGGTRVTNTGPVVGSGWVWAIVSPGAKGHVRCWRVTVPAVWHNSGVIIGVIGTTHPGDIENSNSFQHATGFGWGDGGWYGGCNGPVYLAGENKGGLRDGFGGWPNFGWQRGDEAALRVDCAASTVTLKHRRLDRSFTLQGLDTAVEEWFVNVCLRNAGESVEVQPLTVAEFDAFHHLEASIDPKIKQAFAIFDKDGDGFIDAAELRQTMADVGNDLTEEEAADMIKEADNDGDGRVNLAEFAVMMADE